jgi:hypothetical protein
MMKRSFFLSLAAGLLASLAFGTASQAGTIVVTSNFTVTGGTATDLEIMFTAPVTSYSALSTDLGTPTGVGTSTITFNFSPMNAGYANLDVVTSGSPTAYFLTGLSAGVSASNLHVTFASVPEPSSMALLGIGMTGFLAFRRFFKRGSVA